ncbi:MAG: mitochondrial fission ELM1 family protein [Pseudomonadota bacterium]
MPERLKLWVLSDGRAGHEAQALGLAEALGRIRSAEIETKTVALKPWAAKLPAVVSHGLGGLPIGWPFAGLEDGGASLRWPWPDAVISAGRRAAPVAAALRKKHGITALQLLDPKIGAAAFDAVIVPSHDALQGGNVYRSLGALNRIEHGRLAAESDAWGSTFGAFPSPRLGVLIGGPSGSAQFTDQDASRLCLALENLADHHALLVTTSRRTPPALTETLRTALGDRAFVWEPSDDGPNPYPGLLGHVDAVLVTEDSVNMASEAASTGLPVHVFPISGVAPKIAQFHEDLTAYGASRRFTGTLGSWEYPPLAEANRLAEDLLRRGVLDAS